MTFIDTDARDARGAGLEAKNLNGFDFVLVSLPGEMTPPAALLEVHFVNANRLPTLLALRARPRRCSRSAVAIACGPALPRARCR